jgi:hypothetical protein
MKWQLLTDKDPNAIDHVTDYVNKAKKELEEKIQWAQINWEDEEEEETDVLDCLFRGVYFTIRVFMGKYSLLFPDSVHTHTPLL